MGKAQSVVSTHIAMLEDSIGVELFDRSSRSPVLTEAGRALLPEAHAVLRQSHRFDSCAIAQYGGEAVVLNIVVTVLSVQRGDMAMAIIFAAAAVLILFQLIRLASRGDDDDDHAD